MRLCREEAQEESQLKAAHKDYNLSALPLSLAVHLPFSPAAEFWELVKDSKFERFWTVVRIGHSIAVALWLLSGAASLSRSRLVQLQLSSCRIAVLPGFKRFVCVKTLFIVVNFRLQGLFCRAIFGTVKITYSSFIEKNI